MDKTAFYKLSYGLYLLSAKEADKENGCIINTAVQCAAEPKQISVCVINKNLTCGMILRTGRFNVSVLTEAEPAETFRRFGMRSGRDTDKFAGFDGADCLDNGIRYLKSAAAVFACRVTSSQDLGSHTLFIAEVEQALSLTDGAPMTYAYYQANVKSAPDREKKPASGWRCKVCGYVYEGDELPEGFECPLCHHGAEDFERIGAESEPAPEKKTAKWKCIICGYVHEGDEPPEQCPACHVSSDLFERIE
ncbi:MAG: flavin reductase [Oscillospiraceae bacterium]|nr:flavin reductase [Oscillospiraceae bacterium]